jgi:hypothetical protein
MGAASNLAWILSDDHCVAECTDEKGMAYAAAVHDIMQAMMEATQDISKAANG